MDVSLWEKQKYFLKSELCCSKVPFLTADAGLKTAGSTYGLDQLWSQRQGAKGEVNASGQKPNWSVRNRKPESKSPNSSSPSSCNCLLTFSLWSLGKRIKKVFKQFVEANAFSTGVLSSLKRVQAWEFIIHFFFLSFDRLAGIIFCHPG